MANDVAQKPSQRRPFPFVNTLSMIPSFRRSVG